MSLYVPRPSQVVLCSRLPGKFQCTHRRSMLRELWQFLSDPKCRRPVWVMSKLDAVCLPSFGEGLFWLRDTCEVGVPSPGQFVAAQRLRAIPPCAPWRDTWAGGCLADSAMWQWSEWQPHYGDPDSGWLGSASFRDPADVPDMDRSDLVRVGFERVTLPVETWVQRPSIT